MKTAIVYYSMHHNNTKKLLDAIADRYDVTLIDAAEVKKCELQEFDLIGFASGIYMQKYHPSVLNFAEDNLPNGKRVFLIYTYGMKMKCYTRAIERIIEKRNGHIVGSYDCLGFDTVGPFKLVGGIAKGRPNQSDVDGAVRFYSSLID